MRKKTSVVPPAVSYALNLRSAPFLSDFQPSRERLRWGPVDFTTRFVRSFGPRRLPAGNAAHPADGHVVKPYASISLHHATSGHTDSPSGPLSGGGTGCSVIEPSSIRRARLLQTVSVTQRLPSCPTTMPPSAGELLSNEQSGNLMRPPVGTSNSVRAPL